MFLNVTCSRFALAALMMPTSASADVLQQQTLAAAKQASAHDYAFREATRIQRTGAPDRTVVQDYDPRGGSSAWTLVKIDGRAPTAKERARAAKNSGKARVASYSRIAEWFGAPATRIATTPTSVTYRFARLPKGAVKLGSHDASADTMAEAVVNTAGQIPFVERARFTSTTAFRMMMVVKVERFTFSMVNRLFSDGRPVPESIMTEFGGSFMGKAQTITTETRYSDVQAVPR